MMPLDGELDAVVLSNGMYRWRYITPNGAEFHGPQLYASKRSALKGGRKWLADQGAEQQRVM